MDDTLYAVLDYILNRADDQEIEVILKAVKRRYSKPSTGLGLDAKGMAHEMAGQINQQVGISRDQIRDTVRNLSANIIRQNAPELDDDQIDELMDAWVPDPDKAKPRFSPVPRDALKVMVDQFLRYTTGSMSATEEMNLKHDIPDWTERYWERFPEELRTLISLHLKGTIGNDEFAQGVKVCFEEAPE